MSRGRLDGASRDAGCGVLVLSAATGGQTVPAAGTWPTQGLFTFSRSLSMGATTFR